MTNPKHQINSNSQSPNSLRFGYWRLCVICYLVLGIFLLPQAAAAQSGFHFVPCGRSGAEGTPGTEPCEFRHLITLIVRVINYLISVAAIVAMYQILLNGWNLMTALGNPEKIEHGKEGLSHAVIGFAIIILAFLFVNLLVNGIFGKEGATRQWWDAACIYNPGKAGCPFNPPPGQ